MSTQIRFATLAAALTAALSAPLAGPAAADERSYRPIEAISEHVGSKHVAGYFVNDDGRCQVVVMVEELWDPDQDTPGAPAARLRFDLRPSQSASVDSPENVSISLTCGDKAETLALASSDNRYAILER